MNILSSYLFKRFIVASLILGSLSMLGVERADAAPKASAAQAVQVVNINTATAEELQLIRGIGPALAERIIAYREDKGSFSNINDLANVRGIGTAKLEKIMDQISV